MGNWKDRRYQPRKKCRFSDYEESASSPPRPFNPRSHFSGVEDKKLTSWEMDYCNSLKIPWYKILASKKYIHCYPSVLNWDDSAVKEAFQNAKDRYWAKINGFPCDNTLPAPDMFIDEIDWNPYLDPDLMTDLEHLYFNPDVVDMADDLETVNEGVECAQAEGDTIESGVDNPWEKDHAQTSTSFKDAINGWRQYHDPWEQNQNQLVDSSNVKAWKNGNETWGQSRWHDDSLPSDHAGTRWQGGRGHCRNRTWRHGNASGQEVQNFSHCGWKNNHSIGLQERGWRNKGNDPKNWRESEYPGNEPNQWNPKRFRMAGGRSFQGGF